MPDLLADSTAAEQLHQRGARRSPSLGLAALLTLAAGFLASPEAGAVGPKGPRLEVVDLSRGQFEVRSGERSKQFAASGMAGCTRALYDPGTDPVVTSPSTATVEVLDLQRAGGSVFALLLLSAPANCNVQGECGAAYPDRTLLWLFLSPELEVRKSQLVIVEDCRHDRASDLPEGFGKFSPAATAGGVFRVESWRIGPAKDDSSPAKGQISYDPQHPEVGLSLSGDVEVHLDEGLEVLKPE